MPSGSSACIPDERLQEVRSGSPKLEEDGCVGTSGPRAKLFSFSGCGQARPGQGTTDPFSPCRGDLWFHHLE